MPEYLAPGVYVEETSYRARSIEGVSTSTAGFVGPTRTGPSNKNSTIKVKPEVLTSFSRYDAIYGGLEPLGFGTNYLAHAARAFFAEGGARLYVMRVVADDAAASSVTKNGLKAEARYVGAAGDMRLTFTLRVGGNVKPKGLDALTRLRNKSSVVVRKATGFVVATARRDSAGDWKLADGGGTAIPWQDVVEVYTLTATVEVARPTLDGRGLETFEAPVAYGPLSLDPDAPDGLWQTFRADAEGEPPPVVLSDASGTARVDTLTNALYPPTSPITNWWLSATSPIVAPTAPSPASIDLANGTDGSEPTLRDYEGDVDEVTGLAAFEAIEDISIVAAPGSTEHSSATTAEAIQGAVIGHCERMRYRAAVLDVPEGETVNGAIDWRNQTSTTHAAIYYPWVKVPHPFFGDDLALPPSGFVAGIWARNDIQRAVFKAPANEVIRSITDLTRLLTKGEQDVLNPDGVNCLRFFPGRGNLVWGARTMTDDPEWKYISVRRYFNYLEHSIDKGTQWAVFEPNGEALWANVQRTIEDFMVSEWKSGAMLGTTPEEAFFVRCDRTTMTQNDLDNGRLVCLIGAAVVKPAEYVIFRIGQWTASASS